jgi:hypothetical protein
MSPAEKKKATDDAMSWLEQRPHLDDVDFATAQALETLLVRSDARYDPTRKEKAPRVMDEAMNWLRNNEVKPGDVDVDVLRALTTISGVLMPTGNMSPLKRRRLPTMR